MALEDFVVRNMRIEALKIAVKSFDPDREVPVFELLGVAQTIYDYLVNGEIPQPLQAPPDLGAITSVTITNTGPRYSDEDKVSVGPIEDFEAVNRMELGLKDMLAYGTGSKEVSTVERRQHPEQQDDEPEVL